jgi:hypothetical protein
MLLEKENRFGQAIVLCDQALGWVPSGDWYTKKWNAFLTKLAKQENNKQ